MKTYRIDFYGREKGAIGVFHGCTVYVEAENRKEAVLKTYDTHEHLSHVKIDLEPYHWEDFERREQEK